MTASVPKITDQVSSTPAVLLVGEVDSAHLAARLREWGLALVAVTNDIPGSYWGECEAGLIENRLFVRNDTPLHSVLHEACHYLCADAHRQAQIHTDAGGDDLEEAAVCYLQILLADMIDGFGRERIFSDMDAWGYSFRLGSAKKWFYEDAEDALRWLIDHKPALLQLAGWSPCSDARDDRSDRAESMEQDPGH